MRLKEKTHRKFVEFFEKISNMYQGKDFELAYSDIQRETGAASVTLKRAIQALAEDGVIEVYPGRNSRYARFSYRRAVHDSENKTSNTSHSEIHDLESSDIQKKTCTEGPSVPSSIEDVKELIQIVDHLKRRVRNQEMAIALLQDRLSEVEDKLFRH